MIKPENIPQVAILLNTSNAWGRGIITGILSYAHSAGPWHVWVNARAPANCESLPYGWRGDGIIASVTTPGLARAINEINLPTVNVADISVEGFSAPCIRTDDRVSTRLAVEHFIERGLRNVAIVAPHHTPNPIWYECAFKQAAAEAGLPCQAFTVGPLTAVRMPELTRWLKALPKPVGILTWGQATGTAVVNCCMQAGISVPHDIAVLAGSYDEVLSHASFPAVSGILIPTEKIGYQAAEKLHQLMRGERVPAQTTYLPPLGIMEHLSSDTLAVDDPQMLQVAVYIREHAFQPVSIDEILRAVPMTRRSLERRFRQTFGCSVLDEIQRLRINKARNLLAQSDLSMQRIAEACGYTTYNYLSTIFKKNTGMSPRDYRKQLDNL